MKISSTYLILKTVILYAILIVIMQIQSGCSGCSPSSRRSHQKTDTYKTPSTHTTNRQDSRNRESQRNTTINKPITIKQSQSGNNNLSTMYEQLVKAVIIIYTKDDDNSFQGSGFFIAESGICISNYHVFEGTHKGDARVKTFSGDIYEVSKVIEKNKDLDYIIFEIKANSYKTFPYLQIANSVPKTGEDIFAIGTPEGLSHTLSKGIISQVRSFHEDGDFLQITAEITHGSSGGPLFNFDGEVVGITTAGRGQADLNFALNIQKLRLHRFLNN